MTTPGSASSRPGAPVLPWSVIIPVLDEAAMIRDCLRALSPLREAGHELIVVDGGSQDDTVARAKELCDTCLSCTVSGRARQMHTGALHARGEMLLFLHADTRLPCGVVQCLATLPVHTALWGRFDVRLSGSHPLFRVIETLMNLRSRMSGIATGDQAIFIHRELYRRIGGFPLLDLMEDIAISRTCKAIHSPLCLRQTVLTSSRRWEQRGILRTVLTMWCLRALYACGVHPSYLSRKYR